MSEYELTDLGAGKFALSGDVSFRTAESVLRASDDIFSSTGDVEIDLAEVSRTDSAGMALLLEWLSRANGAGVQLRFANVPQKIQAIAVTAEIDDLLKQAQSPASSSNSSSSK